MPISAGELKALLSGIDDNVMVYFDAIEDTPTDLIIGMRHNVGDKLKSLETNGVQWVEEVKDIIIRKSPGSYIIDSSTPYDGIEIWSAVPMNSNPFNDKGLSCWDCGIGYGDIGWTESFVHQHDWEILIGDLHEQTILCVPCIKDRAERYGIQDLRIQWFTNLGDHNFSEEIIEGPDGWYEKHEKEINKLREESMNRLSSNSQKTSGFDESIIGYTATPYHSIGDTSVIYATKLSLGVRYLLPGIDNYVGLKELTEDIFGSDNEDIAEIFDNTVDEILRQTKQELNILMQPMDILDGHKYVAAPTVAFWCCEVDVVDKFIDELVKKRESVWGPRWNEL